MHVWIIELCACPKKTKNKKNNPFNLQRTFFVRRLSESRSWRRPSERVFRLRLSERWCLHKRRLPGHCRRNKYANVTGQT